MGRDCGFCVYSKAFSNQGFNSRLVFFLSPFEGTEGTEAVAENPECSRRSSLFHTLVLAPVNGYWQGDWVRDSGLRSKLAAFLWFIFSCLKGQCKGKGGREDGKLSVEFIKDFSIDLAPWSYRSLYLKSKREELSQCFVLKLRNLLTGDYTLAE